MNQKKNICICAVQIPFVQGGAEIHVQSIKEQLMARGYRAEIVSLPYKWHPKIEILKNCLAWRLLNLNETYLEQIHLVIGTKFPSYVIKHPRKVVWLLHQHREVYELFDTPYSAFTESEEDQEIREAICSIDQTSLKEALKVYSNSLQVSERLKQYNGLESEPLYHPPKHLGHYYTKDYEPYLLSVGRLELNKRPDLLIRAMAKVKAPLQCVIVGEGGQREVLENLINQLEVQDKVKILGWVDNQRLLELYANCRAVYFAPFDEDYGYITQEAFLSKKPVITASDSGAVLEFVKDGVNGWICPPQEEAFAEKINSLQRQKKLCKTYGENGYESVKHINWDHVIDCLIQFLD